MQSSTFPGFPSTDPLEALSEASTPQPVSSPRATVPRQQPQPPSRARSRPNEEGLLPRLEALSLAFNDMRQVHNKLFQDQADLQARVADLECTAGRVDSAFGHLSSLHAVVQGRDLGNFRRGGARGGYERGGAERGGFDRDGHGRRTPPGGRFNTSRGRGGRSFGAG